jgi:CheY-like chemotaxis protein
MTDDLFSLRVIVASASPSDCEMFRKAAAVSTIPIELVEADDAAAAGRSMAAGVDLAFFDMALGGEAVERMTTAARSTGKPPFTVLLCAPGTEGPFATDALACKPSAQEDASRLLAGSIRVRLPSRVLVVDDSATMRRIVCKVLAATRFPLEMTETDQGMRAVELARDVAFDIVFLDYNMPGFSGLQTIAEFRRAQRFPAFVLMTSTPDEAVAEKARAQGAAFLKKPFFPADLEAVLCSFYGLRALNPQRA